MLEDSLYWWLYAFRHAIHSVRRYTTYLLAMKDWNQNQKHDESAEVGQLTCMGYTGTGTAIDHPPVLPALAAAAECWMYLCYTGRDWMWVGIVVARVESDWT
jgi:hypothetical protein